MNAILPITLENVRLVRGRKALLEEMSLTLVAGSRTVVLGPNGAGKSLLLRLLHGLVVPTDGRLTWSGREPARGRSTCAMVFQQPVLLRRSVAANVSYALAVRGVKRGERRRVCEEMLERTGLAPLARRPARTLSGGEQQRVVIARAWAVSPEVLLLDEPTASLDPTAVASVEELIRDVHASGTKIVMTTHDLSQARRLADDIVFLNRGRCLEHTSAVHFFESPKSPEARDFLAGRLLA